MAADRGQSTQEVPLHLSPCSLVVLMASTVCAFAAEKDPKIVTAEAAIKAADLELARAVAQDDKALFNSLIATDAVFYGREQSIGPQQVIERWTHLLTPGGPSLEWWPDTATVFPAGDLGFTTGHYLYQGKDKDGRPVEGRGNYLTVWRKGEDGKWRATVDIGT